MLKGVAGGDRAGRKLTSTRWRYHLKTDELRVIVLVVVDFVKAFHFLNLF